MMMKKKFALYDRGAKQDAANDKATFFIIPG